MALDLFGSLHSGYFSETIAASSKPFDVEHIARVATSHEAAGFDGVLVPFSSTAPDNFLTIAAVAAATQKLRFLISHRPGFVAPTLAARMLATLDQLTGGRLALHLIAGSRNFEQRRDGDYLDHDARFERMEEYLTILRQLWTSEHPIDHVGKYYRFERGLSDVRPVNGQLPVSIGGASPAAIAVAARHADAYPIWAETLGGVSEMISAVRASVPANQQPPRFGLSLRIILGGTEEEAWRNARHAVEKVEEIGLWAKRGYNSPVENTGTKRLLGLVDKGEVLDSRLYTGLARATGAPGSVTALVGTGEQVAQAMWDYRQIGIESFWFRGLDPHRDAEIFGAELIPLLRAQPDAVAQAA
ncbi:LLM class flavin-dependent oxidoreductase [Aureimonas fodinaquatilis]|uniref:LLM class flavin-dependent oxidoreductase n=1 Tax=Aureimonas fodinaquatilis TaxID=2565783 RepID=A0A5B0DXZ7_9HYPH|nr:LLM class flavin-dependent oxidoreductase [Aureimonas fodinaquatilis]KAA0970882.1 LLM class flavin-dependent oxidoreductase [Aureimonas fodinaquatilis]